MRPRCEVDAALAAFLQTPRPSAKWQKSCTSQADAHETRKRNSQPAGKPLSADRSEPLVLMLLIQMVLHWLKPVALAIELIVERATNIAFPAVLQTARRHHIGLALIHAPPLRLTS